MFNKKSFIINSGNVFEQNSIDIAFDSRSQRRYLSTVKNIELLNVNWLKELSHDCKAVVIDFDSYNEKNLIEIECYLDNDLKQDKYLGFKWVDKPCALEVNDIVFNNLIKSLSIGSNELRVMVAENNGVDINLPYPINNEEYFNNVEDEEGSKDRICDTCETEITEEEFNSRFIFDLNLINGMEKLNKIQRSNAEDQINGLVNQAKNQGYKYIALCVDITDFGDIDITHRMRNNKIDVTGLDDYGYSIITL